MDTLDDMSDSTHRFPASDDTTPLPPYDGGGRSDTEVLPPYDARAGPPYGARPRRPAGRATPAPVPPAAANAGAAAPGRGGAPPASSSARWSSACGGGVAGAAGYDALNDDAPATRPPNRPRPRRPRAPAAPRQRRGDRRADSTGSEAAADSVEAVAQRCCPPS